MAVAFAVVAATLSFLAPPSALSSSRAPAAATSRAAPAPQMINLFGNNERSSKQREALSFRTSQAGDRVVSFRKPNTATTGLTLGLKFKESFGKAVYIDKIIPGTEADRLRQDGKIQVGDEIVMVSATFGDELWSARGVGKYRLEKSIAVRQGMVIKFVLENSSGADKKRRQQEAEAAKREASKVGRLQKQLTQEVEAQKKSGWFW
jgi:hypothetical protein